MLENKILFSLSKRETTLKLAFVGENYRDETFKIIHGVVFLYALLRRLEEIIPCLMTIQSYEELRLTKPVEVW